MQDASDVFADFYSEELSEKRLTVSKIAMFRAEVNLPQVVVWKLLHLAQ